MIEERKNKRPELINKIRISLLAACFGISMIAALFGVWFMYDIVADMKGNMGDYIKVILIVLSFTAAGQILYNEWLLSPIQAFLCGELNNDKGNRLNPSKAALVSIGVWFVIWAVAYAMLALTYGVGMGFAGYLAMITLTGILLGALTYYALKKKNFAAQPLLEETAYALTLLPLRSALFSLGMWLFAGILIGLSFYFYIRLSSFRSFHLFFFAISAGILAFPLQYFIFKRVVYALWEEVMNSGSSSMKIEIRFPIKLKLLMSLGALVIYCVGFFGILNLSKSSQVLKKQTELILAQTIESALPTGMVNNPDIIEKKMKYIAEAYRATPFWIAPDGSPKVNSLNPIYTDAIDAVSSGAHERAMTFLGEDVLILMEDAGGSRYGLIYPFENFNQPLGEIRNKIIFFAVFSIVVAVAMALLISSDISSPIEKLRRETIRIGSSDNYTWEAQLFSDDEMADLESAYRSMALLIGTQVEKVKSLLEGIGYTVHHLGTSASQLEAIAQNQAAGSAQQASAIQQTLTTAGEIAATARQIAENALTVDNVAIETGAACESSNKVVSQTIGGIEEVREHVTAVAHGTIDLARLSQRIGGIIDIIEEINEQTNLISVNASIEASAAGAEGKRFLVLAREIRRLADGTLDATEQIRVLVGEIRKSTTSTVMMAEESTKVVDSWAEKVQKLGESFSNISMLVELASRATGEISTSTKQQTTACEQMAQVIAEVKEVADQVVTTSKETEKSMADLTELTINLRGIVESNMAGGEIV